MVDELTGLPNRRAFFLRGVQEIERCQRHKTPLSLLWLDLDGFKEINDTYGHDAGDAVLQQFSNILTGNICGIDTAARVGGEEFSVLLPDTEIKNAVKLAERIRAAVEQENIQVHDQNVSLTVSIGVAGYNKDLVNLPSIIKVADHCMYEAKVQGRNRVVHR